MKSLLLVYGLVARDRKKSSKKVKEREIVRRLFSDIGHSKFWILGCFYFTVADFLHMGKACIKYDILRTFFYRIPKDIDGIVGFFTNFLQNQNSTMPDILKILIWLFFIGFFVVFCIACIKSHESLSIGKSLAIFLICFVGTWELCICFLPIVLHKIVNPFFFWFFIPFAIWTFD